ncbi:MAG: XdhC/CoxI family protein, partial [Gemmatimonadetes bacterium]|nr:XdhC/CoxI family protein [Gemmatimonadota bacterium]
GGCVEVAVVDEARALLDEGGFRLLTYGVADADAWAVGLACGGTVRVAVSRVGAGAHEIAPALLEAAVAAEEGGEPVVLAYDLAAGGALRAERTAAGDTVAAVVRGARPQRIEGTEGELLLRPFVAPVRIAIIGAVHVAQSLAALARVVGLEVVVVDPREAFARSARFPEVELVTEWPAEGLAAIGLDSRTAVVALTHDPKLDDPALSAALASDAFYVGALGSRRTHARRRARLAEAGVAETDLDRIHAPVGLDLGGRAPEEIAVSILAEIVAVRRGGGVVRGG